MASETRGLKLLALDGGGIRGLSELLILEDIMDGIKEKDGVKSEKPCEYFDIIGGTGTGGIIAILLGRLCMPIDKAIKEYHDLTRRVFSQKKCKWASTLEDAMKDIVKRHDEGEDTRMETSFTNERNCKTFVCALTPSNMSHPRLFRSYRVTSGREYNAKIWEAARATSAAPPFFKSIRIGDNPKEEFTDGNLKCNNPTRQVYYEARKVHGTNRPISCIVSIGAGHPGIIMLEKPEMLKYPKNWGEALTKIATDCEERSDEFKKEDVERMKSEMGGTEKVYFRFNVLHGLQYVGLEEWTKMDVVKTHTKQYLLGAEVSEEVKKVVEVLGQKMDVPQLT